MTSQERDFMCEEWCPADGEPHGSWVAVFVRPVTLRKALRRLNECASIARVVRLEDGFVMGRVGY